MKRMVLCGMLLCLLGACSVNRSGTMTLASNEPDHRYAHLYSNLSAKAYQDPAFSWIMPYSQILSADKEARKN